MSHKRTAFPGLSALTIMAGMALCLSACGAGGQVGEPSHGEEVAGDATRQDERQDERQDSQKEAGSSEADAPQGDQERDGSPTSDEVVEAEVVSGGKSEDKEYPARKVEHPDSEAPADVTGDGDGSSFPESLVTGNGQIVLQYPNDSATRLVFSVDGNDVTAFSSYIDCGSPETAYAVAMGLSDAHDGSIRSVRVDGSCIIVEHSEATYANLTAESLGKAFSGATQI